jgi:hypothetical protein
MPNGKLTSATVLLREQPGFYEQPRFSRRLVKRLVRVISSILPIFVNSPRTFERSICPMKIH